MKVGVNFPVTGAALERCLAFNVQLRSLTESKVSFGAGGNSSPHVTIAMGTLRSSDDVEALEAAVARAVAAFPGDETPPTMTFGPVYRENLTGHYIFSDVTFPEEVQRWRTQTQGALETFFVEPARTTEVPHLTLGHVSDHYEEVDAHIDTTHPLIPACDILSVDVSLNGSKGIKQYVRRNLALVF